jgi:hypothetical protein
MLNCMLLMDTCPELRGPLFYSVLHDVYASNATLYKLLASVLWTDFEMTTTTMIVNITRTWES